MYISMTKLKKKNKAKSVKMVLLAGACEQVYASGEHDRAARGQHPSGSPWLQGGAHHLQGLCT